MAVAFDAQSTTDTLIGATNVANHNHLTVGSSLANAGMVICIATAGTPPAVSSVVWDPSPGTNQAASLITALTGNVTFRVELWGLVGSITSGNKTLQVTWAANV